LNVASFKFHELCTRITISVSDDIQLVNSGKIHNECCFKKSTELRSKLLGGKLSASTNSGMQKHSP